MFRRTTDRLLRWGAVPALLLVIATSSGLPRIASAQTVDPALIEQVSSALAQTAAQSSLTLESRSVTEAEGLPAGFDLSQQSTRTALLVRAGEGWHVSSTDTSISTTPQGEFRITSETITVDGTTYIRFTEVPEDAETGFPAVWTDTATLIEGAAVTAGADPGSQDPLGELALPITLDSVSAINLLADDAINGQTMHVIQITLDPATVLESGTAGLLQANAGFGIGMGAGGAFGADGQMPALPEGVTVPEGVTPPTMGETGEAPALAPEDVQITLAVYIGADDGLIHRVYRVIALAPTQGGMPIALTTTTLTNYSDHGAPAEITAPELGM